MLHIFPYPPESRLKREDGLPGNREGRSWRSRSGSAPGVLLSQGWAVGRCQAGFDVNGERIRVPGYVTTKKAWASRVCSSNERKWPPTRERPSIST